VPGQPPDLLRIPHGCAFADRCEHCFDRCRIEEPRLRKVTPEHRKACHLESL
jgi:oligopeptide/dipeptide ABC transporter ATP-binding protein